MTISNVHNLFTGPGVRPRAPVAFTRQELAGILNIYGKLVAAGLWRDYALEMDCEEAVFAAFVRSCERPDVRIVKRPALARKQGAFALLGSNGLALKRGTELASVLAPLERKLLRVLNPQ